jgi:iron complex outermembrane receptor protein
MKKTKLLLSTGALLLWPAAQALAQTPAPAPQEQEDEIIITGIRASLMQAVEIKREAEQVLDVITAEDVGKLPDSNVAEALQRVTGVQITRVFGEGQAVNVRGLQQVRVEIDGRTLLGWSARLSPPENDQLGRSSGLDAVPSGLFGRLEVQKSPLASNAEGGLSGTVNLVTPRPLSLRPTLAVRASGTYSEVSGEFEPAFTGLWSHRFFDDRLGLLFAVEHQERTSTVQAFERNNFLNRNYSSGGVTTVNQTPVLLQYENFVVDRSRTGYTAVAQFEVTPDLVVTADWLFSELTTGRYQDFLSWRLPTGTNPVTNPVLNGSYVVAGAANGTLTTAGQIRNEPTESELFGFNAAFDRGPLSLEFDAYHSEGTIDQTIQIITLQATAAVPGTFDFRGGVVPSLTLGTSTTPYNPTLYSNFNPASNGVRSNRLIGLLEEDTYRFDVSYDLAENFEISAGLRTTDLHARSNAYRSQTTRPRTEIEPFTSVVSGGFLGDIGGAFPRTFLTTRPTFNYVFTTAQAAQPNPNPNDQSTLLPNAQRDYDLEESTTAAYVMISGSAEIAGIPVTYNAGVRYIDTELSVDTFRNIGSTSTLVTDTSAYSMTLPSANAVFEVTPNFLVRLSASQTMQRASIADLAPSEFFNATNLSVTGGNAALQPPRATQADISFEYYTGESSLISGAIFVKSVDNFIANFVTQGVDLDLDPAGRTLTFSRPENLASAEVRGLEIGVQQFLDFLPAPFNGFGFIANYTYADSEDNNGFPLVAVSEHSYNLIGLYESGRLSGRIAYNWRDDALFEFSEGRPSFIAARSQLDAQLGYDVSDTIQLSLQATNLIPEDSATVEYSGSSATTLNSYALSERRFTIGLRARF